MARKKKRDKIVNKGAATVKSPIDGHRVKMSFHELREALVFTFSDGVISEEQFLILYEEYESTNLNFPHWEYEPFSLDNFDSSEARAEFRVDKEDIPLLKMKLARYIRLNRYYLSLTSLLVVSRRGGRGSDPVKKVNIIFNNKQINN